MAQIVAVVDPLSSGLDLAVELAKRKFELVQVLSQPVPETLKSIAGSSTISWKQRLDFSESKTIESIADALALLDCRYVVAGCETGVELADALCRRLGLSANGMLQSAARRDKFKMTEAVESAGLCANRQRRIQAWSDVAKWLEQPGSLPAVVKPPASAGSDCVFKCSNEDDIKNALNCVLHSTNCLGLNNDGAIIQDFLDGAEYVIDSCSYQGQHRAINVWKYDKREANGRAFVYYSLQSVNTNPLSELSVDEDAVRCCMYVFKVLDALQVVEGLTHAEVIVDKVRGPVLVEVGC